jgi:thiol:disulfide interchange protein
MRNTRIAGVLLVLASGLLAQQASVSKDPMSVKLRQLYPDTADAKKEIAEALEAATKEHKRVLLVFGASWCFDCFALDYRFHQPGIQPIVDKNYRVVHVNVGDEDTKSENADLVSKYAVPLDKGIPSLVVLDSQGHTLYRTAEFESARQVGRDPVLKFLETWKPPETAN